MDEATSSRQPINSSKSYANLNATTTCSPAFAAERARLMFGCYRRSDAADPETYTAAVAMVLAHYPAEIVKAVTDPYGGLPARKTDSGWSGLPDVADVKQACEGEAVRRERLAKLAALPPPSFRRVRPPPAGAGALATVLIRPDFPRYAAMLERTQTADPREWRQDEEGCLWVAWSWLETSAMKMKAFQPFTDDQLRERYGVKPARPLDDEEIAW